MGIFDGVREEIKKMRLERQIQNLVDMPPEVLIAIGEYLKNPTKPNMSLILTEGMDIYHMMLTTMFIMVYVEKVYKPDPEAYEQAAIVFRASVSEVMQEHEA
jgi:hypothetical protein